MFDVEHAYNYFDSPGDSPANNKRILQKIAAKSYLPTNKKLLELLKKRPEFKISLSMTGTVLEQLEPWATDALQSFVD